MNLNFKLIVITLSLYVISAQAQDYKFGKVSKEELAEKYYVQDSSAIAAVLYREYNVRYEYFQSSGFRIVTDVHQRVKIYKKEGFDYATVSEQLYQSESGGEKESFENLKAYTYNLVDGKIEETKLKGSDTYTTNISKYYDEEKFTLPDVKIGSVIEYEYSIYSPFYYTLDEVVLQYDIPIKRQHISIDTPEYFAFSPRFKGFLKVIPKHIKKAGKINLQSKVTSGASSKITGKTEYRSSSVDYTINVSEFTMDNVPALKEESYVNNMDNYRSSVNYELQFVKFPQEPIQSYSTTWEKVTKTIYDNPNFGNQLKNTRYFKAELPIILADASTEIERLNAVFSYVQRYMNWNGNYSKYADLGVKTAFKEKTGNVADINLMLVAMLKEADIKSYPVILSTRDNGIPLFPTREGFNYVIASAEINDKIILMDATNKYSEPNLIPTRALNWLGRLIKEDGTSTSISLSATMKSQEVNMIQAKLESNGSLEGLMRTIYKDYYAYNFRNRYNSFKDDDYLEKLENKNNSMEISNYSIDNKNDIGELITEKFKFSMDSQAETIGNKIYFAPTLFKTLNENPFKLDERNYPIDFIYPWGENLIINLTIPDGYQVESLPTPIALNLPKNLGSFKYIISNENDQIKLVVSTDLNTSIIGAQDYPDLKEFYRLIVQKETEKVVLSKI